MRAIDRRRRTVSGDVAPARRHRPDYWLLILVVALLVIGIVVVYSISPALAVEKNADGSQYVLRQLIAIGLGLGLFAFAATVPLSFWKHIYKPLLILAAVATLLTLFMPINDQYPAHRWIRLGGFSFQSVELLKLALLVWFAKFLVERANRQKLHDMQETFMPFLFVLLSAGIVVAGLQSDFGSAVVMSAILIALAFVIGVPMKRIMLIGAILAAGAILVIAGSSYRRERLMTYLNPEKDCLTTGYQACQALIAVGSGGMIGLGLGNSVQAYGYLPEAENDSIFAIYAEKFGFIGVAVIIGLLAALYARMKRIADRAPDDFSRLLVFGAMVWLSTQAIINIGAMLGLLPLKGITLPLISYGGSSVLMVLLVLGIVFNVSRYTSLTMPRKQQVRGRSYDNSRDRRRVRGAYNTPAGGRI